MLAALQSIFATLVAIVQLLLSILGVTPLSKEPISYGGDPYVAPVIAEPYKLIESGESDYVIIVGENASVPERTAATYLQDYIQRISGKELPIQQDSTAVIAHEICVGATNRGNEALAEQFAKLKDEGFVKLMQDEKLFILGMGTRGTLYGVGSFLEEQLGCRFFTPELYTVPSNSTVTIDKQLNDLQNPAFGYRDVLWRVGFKSTEWKLFNRVNSSFGSEQPAEYGGGIGYADFCHTLEHIIPESLYGEYPEYFSWRNDEGKRTLHQRCLSNPALVDIAIENVENIIKNYQGEGIMSISQNDNSEYCQCANCAAMDAQYGSAAGTLLQFVNKIVEALGPKYPNITFETLAYQYTRKAPVGIKPAPGMIIRLCSIECCFVHPLAECGHERGEDLIERVQTKESTFASDVADWSQITDTLWIWNYTTNYKLNQLPHPNFHTFAGDLDWFIENNVVGVFEQGNNDDLHSGEFGEMRAYILAKLLWNPKANVEQMMMEFMSAYYGADAAPYIKQYLDAITRKNKETAHLFCFNWQDEGAYFTGIDVAKMDKLWDKAEENAETQEQLQNVRRSRLQLRVYKACQLQGEFSLLNKNRLEANRQLVMDMLELGITQMSSGKNIVVPDGLDWLLRPVEWIDLDDMPWNNSDFDFIPWDELEAKLIK